MELPLLLHSDASLSNGNAEDFAHLISRLRSSRILSKMLSEPNRDASFAINGFVIWSMHSRSCAADRSVGKHSYRVGDDSANDVDDDDDVDLDENWCGGTRSRCGIVNGSAAVVSNRVMTMKVAKILSDVIVGHNRHRVMPMRVVVSSSCGSGILQTGNRNYREMVVQEVCRCSKWNVYPMADKLLFYKLYYIVKVSDRHGCKMMVMLCRLHKLE